MPGRAWSARRRVWWARRSASVAIWRHSRARAGPSDSSGADRRGTLRFTTTADRPLFEDSAAATILGSVSCTEPTPSVASRHDASAPVGCQEMSGCARRPRAAASGRRGERARAETHARFGIEEVEPRRIELESETVPWSHPCPHHRESAAGVEAAYQIARRPVSQASRQRRWISVPRQFSAGHGTILDA